MKLFLDAVTTLFYTGSKPKVTAVFGYTNNVKDENQAIDEATGLKVWSTELEFIQGDYAEQKTKIKILSDKEPELLPRTEYKADGQIIATPYLKDGARNASVSIAVLGGFKPAHSRPALPVKND